MNAGGSLCINGGKDRFHPRADYIALLPGELWGWFHKAPIKLGQTLSVLLSEMGISQG